MTPFFMDEKIAQQLQALAAFAETQRYPLAEMLRREARAKAGIIDDQPFPEEHTALMPSGYRVVFTIEQHPYRDGSGAMWLRHMSMSSPNAGKVPINQAIEWAMGQLGYTSALSDCLAYVEDYGEGRLAVNVLEEIKTNMAPGRA